MQTRFGREQAPQNCVFACVSALSCAHLYTPDLRIQAVAVRLNVGGRPGAASEIGQGDCGWLKMHISMGMLGNYIIYPPESCPLPKLANLDSIFGVLCKVRRCLMAQASESVPDLNPSAV